MNAMRFGVRGIEVEASMLIALAATSCRGHHSDRPPMRLVQEMAAQPYYRPQSWVAPAPPGATEPTIAIEHPVELDATHTGKGPRGYVARAPIKVDGHVVRRGEDRFNAFCSPCHDKAGSGQGVVVQRGFPTAMDLASEHALNLSDGEIFGVISRGQLNMPALSAQLSVEDRWATVIWVRVLQRSQHTQLAQVPSIDPAQILDEERSE